MNATLSGPLGRRTVLATGAAVVATTAVAGATVSTAGPSSAAAATHSYFLHGVASGDPLPTAVVLWTRVTPAPTATPGSGVGATVTVRWQVSRDAAFTSIVASGTQSTGTARDHTVKVDATGLAAATTYYYRFSYAGAYSPVGTTRTAPATTSEVDNLRLGVVSCANLQAGWFSAYRHLAARTDLHAILHLGDYVYEYGGAGSYGKGKENVHVREHEPAREMVTLSDYRRRHAQYKQDPDLAALHAKYAFITTWDDHEVTNDAWKDGAENHQPGEVDYRARRADAQRAYDEWMPIRLSGSAALGDGTVVYRRLQFGQLATLSMLDLRTYRDQQVAGLLDQSPDAVTGVGGVADPDRTITGRAQMDWLKAGLTTASAQWKLVGNPVMIAPVNFASLPDALVDPVADVTGVLPRDGMPYNADQWDGYTDDRREVITHLRDQGVRDTVFLTGDIHSGWACDLPADAGTYPVTGDSAGVEFVCTSVTSNNLKDITGTPSRTSSIAVEEGIKANNTHIKYLNFDDHGFSVLDLTPARAQMDWFVIGDRADKNTGVAWTASFETRSGENKVRPVAKPVNA